jgi:hypothetical protein
MHDEFWRHAIGPYLTLRDLSSLACASSPRAWPCTVLHRWRIPQRRVSACLARRSLYLDAYRCIMPNCQGRVLVLHDGSTTHPFCWHHQCRGYVSTLQFPPWRESA